MSSSSRWAPSHPGSAQVFELSGTELKLQAEVEKKHSFKCGTFGASSSGDRRLATGNFNGELQLWDLECTNKPIFEVQAHASIVNKVDGCGGQVLPHARRPRAPPQRRWPTSEHVGADAGVRRAGAGDVRAGRVRQGVGYTAERRTGRVF
jgi:hypothetical protein